MLRKLLLFFTLTCTTQCERSPYSTENLYAILDRATEYFKDLRNAHVILNNDTKNSINNEIAKYVNSTAKEILQRSKRGKRGFQNEPNKGVNVLQSFEETLSFDLPDFQDMAFFFIQDEHQIFWLAVNSSRILFYQLAEDQAQLVGWYPQLNAKRIIVHNYSAGTLIVIQKDIDGIVILHLSKDENGIYELQFKQEFEIPGVLHMNIWLGTNQLYLGIASETRIFIYVWLGEHFDKIDTLPYGARKLMPFQSKSFMHVVVVGSLTKILRFSVRSNKFVEMQKLHYADDASVFHFKEGHFEEHFLVLAGNESTILYKEMYGRFVPFQQIAPARQIHSPTMGNTVILFSMEQNTTGIYQYNGWRFLRLHAKLSSLRQIRSIHSYDKDMLVTQNQAGEWKFLSPVWTVKRTWKSLRDETAAWCSEIKQKASQRTLEKVPDLKSLVISNAHIGQLRSQNINDYDTEELVRLTKQYKSTIAKLNLTSSLLAQRTEDAERSKHTVLHGKKMTVKCKTNCHVHRIITDNGIKPKYVESESNESLQFAKLKVETVKNWKCPTPNFKIDDIFVKGSVNGILMRDLQEGTLKVSGDQVISGNHIFTNLHATNVSIPLDIATRSVKRTVYMKEAKVKDLYLTKDDFFLPLNGPAVVMNGSITAAEVRVTGLVEVSGRIKGEGIERLKPMKEILTPLTLHGDRFLQNVTFRNIVKAKDIVRPRGLSVKEILENSIPLDSNVSVHLILSSDKTQWSNVTLWNSFTTNLVTKNSAETVVITGTKYTNNNVTLSSAAYGNLPIPKLTTPLCAEVVISPEIRTSSMKVGDINVKNLNVLHVLGAHSLNTTIFQSVPALQTIDFSAKLFTGQVFVKNISVSEIKGTNLQDLKTVAMNEWPKQSYFKGPVNIAKLVVNNLETPAHFNLSLPTRVKNVIIKGDSDIGKINGINIQSFMENVLKVDDPISLEHVIFARGFTSSNVHASRSTLKLPHLDTHLNLGSKRISTTLSANAINVPQTFGYAASDAPSTFIIHGSVRFFKEPVIQNVNDVDLKQLSENIWMANQNTILSGSNMNFENITLMGKIILKNDNNSLNVKMWVDRSSRFLSKTKKQHITVASSFKNVEVPTIHAENNSILQSSDLNLNNLLTNSLMRNTAQTIDANWHFEELYINNMNWDGKFNGIDLKTDIVRRDAKRNKVMGKTKILNLTTKNLRALNINFSNFTRYALTQKCQKKLSVIKGQKIFKDIILNNLSVNGTIMGRNVEDALLKFGNQTLFNTKMIQGQLNAPSLIINGTVNDINLMELMNKQLKKHKAVQIIESKMDFRNNFEIFGNITIHGLYGGINLTNISGQNKINDVLNRMTEVVALTEDMTTALQNRAIYVNKFEVVDEDALQISNTSNTEDVMYMNLNSTCLCETENMSSFCNDTELLNVIVTNVSAFLAKKLILLDDTVFLVLVSTDFISIYSYNDEQFYQVSGLYVPNILEVSMESIDHSLWIFLQLPEETLILRYHAWNEFDQNVLPGSDTFVISKTPNGQHLLIRSDGMWNLGGLFRPEHIFKMSLEGQIKTFARGADYYVKAITKNSTTVLKARYVGN